MIAQFLNLLFGCAHRHTSWPMRPVGSHSVSGDVGKERCWDCGRSRWRSLTAISSDWIADAAVREVHQ